MSRQQGTEYVGTIVIGGGQAGLSVGYHLARRGLPYLILDANQRIGDSWRNRWDSLQLFTTARYAGLPGMPFPARGDAFPTKDEMADYLESYARRFNLTLRNGVSVNCLLKSGNRFEIGAGDRKYEADNVVIAMSNYQRAAVPEFARQLDPGIVQIHSADYRNPSQLREGGVLVVGVGNSGADIGIEVARTHPTWLSGKETGHVPFRLESVLGRFVMSRIVRFVFHHILTLGTPMGRRLRPKMLHQASPLIRVRPTDLENAGIERVGRIVGVKNGQPLLADDRVLEVTNVIWCTGFDPGLSWIELPVFDTDGEPKHDRGVVAEAPGLYFVGRHFQYSMSSATIFGVARDAQRVAAAITSRRVVVRAA